MKTIKIMLAASTALGLSMTAASADSNRAFLDQNGDDNIASVDQSGGVNNRAGRGDQVMTQNGNMNTLDVRQSGTNGHLGTGTGVAGGQMGVFQSYGGTNPSRPGNVLIVNQSNNRNTIGTVVQTAQADQRNQNTADLIQSGARNEVDVVYQAKSSSGQNDLDLLMSGDRNTISLLEQRVGTGGNALNDLDVTISGDDNGGLGLSGKAGDVGATASSLIQVTPSTSGSTGQTANLTISGNQNQFGVTQISRTAGIDGGNTVGALVISGNLNELGIYQVGNQNTVSLATVAGNGNNLGILQDGETNLSGVRVAGNSNVLGTEQTGNTNMLDVNIVGDMNGGALGFTSLVVPVGVAAGEVVQMGDLNSATMEVFGSSNVFGLTQDGNSNSIVGNQGTISSDGSFNQVAVLQTGDSNVANFSQDGDSNSAVISQ